MLCDEGLSSHTAQGQRLDLLEVGVAEKCVEGMERWD
jgi:hypothetical protein